MRCACPKGERVVSETKSSGTSGTPGVRTFRHAGDDSLRPRCRSACIAGRVGIPALTQAVIRQARVLPKNKDGSSLQEGEVQRVKRLDVRAGISSTPTRRWPSRAAIRWNSSWNGCARNDRPIW